MIDALSKRIDMLEKKMEDEQQPEGLTDCGHVAYPCGCQHDTSNRLENIWECLGCNFLTNCKDVIARHNCKDTIASHICEKKVKCEKACGHPSTCRCTD